MSSSNTVCLYFDYDVDLCLQRIHSRLNHPTIQAGRGRNAVNQMLELLQVRNIQRLKLRWCHTRQNTNLWQKPTLAEGFGAILTVSSLNAAKEAILLLGGTVSITKFPRTTHLINLGASTADDIIKEDLKDDLKGQIVIEEKIDGANMGFSLDYDKNILVQVRNCRSATHRNERIAS